MGIDVRCAACGDSYRVADQWAGRKAKCPKCDAQIDIPPAATPASPTPTARLSAEQILAAVDLESPRAGMPIAYRLASALVAMLMLLLPLLYIALIGWVGYLMYLHATSNTAILEFTAGGPRGGALRLLIYVTPIIAGAIMIFFMCKPLVARQATEGRIRSLTRDSDPLLYAFVERLSHAVGSPVPKRIDVDCQVNASASLGQGLLAVLGSRRLVLTIGLSLVAGLDLRQFTGVIAHELGHFSQGAGMRLYWITAHVNNWFARAVYERDAWDYRLERYSTEVDFRIAIVLLLARLGVWLTRRILWCFMMVGHVASAHLSRHMEFDADRKAAMLVGSGALEAMLRQTFVLDFAQQKANADLNLFHADGRLADNLPRLVAINAGDFDKDDRKKIDEIYDGLKTGLFDTYPSPTSRTKVAQRLEAPCRFNVDLPATVLFGNFDHLSQAATLDVYFAVFGPKFDRSKIHSLSQLVARRDQEKKAGEVLDRYMLGQAHPLRPIWLPSATLDTPKDPRQTAAELKQARQEVARLSTAYAVDRARLDKAHDQRLDAEMGKAVFEVGGDAQITKQFDNPIDSRQQANAMHQQTTARARVLDTQMTAFERAMGARLNAALSLLGVEKVAERIPNGRQWFAECRRLVPILYAVEREYENINAAGPLFSRLHILIAMAEQYNGEEMWARRVMQTSSQLREQIGHCRQILLQVECGIDHAEKDMTVGRYIVSDLPAAEDPVAVHGAAGAMMGSYQHLRDRLRARLATVAGKVESTLGLEPLPAPPEEPPKS